MREIKFRFYDKFDKKMYNIDNLDFKNSLTTTIHSRNDCRVLHLWWYWYQIMQYTWLKDKANKNIFDWDILYFEMYKDSWVVKYDEAKGAFVIVWNNPKEWCPTENEIAYRGGDCEIIWNIHENSDLIDNK
jgi:uncharacterized phage protein (TIGR01671 family)